MLTPAVCALSSDSDRSYLAYPSPSPSSTSTPLSSSSVPGPPPAPTAGDVLLFDTITLSALNVIQAHKSPIAHLALNSTGTMLATASEKGTVVRVFSVPDAKQLWQFRRGSSSARIWSINFNLANTLLAVSSDSSTIHIYRLQGTPGRSALPEPEEELRSPTPSETTPVSSPPERHSSSSLGKRTFRMGKTLVGGVGGYLPRSVSERWEPQRDFAYIKLRGTQGRTVVALSA
jgi:autophagy-related protein 18